MNTYAGFIKDIVHGFAGTRVCVLDQLNSMNKGVQLVFCLSGNEVFSIGSSAGEGVQGDMGSECEIDPDDVAAVACVPQHESGLRVGTMPATRFVERARGFGGVVKF